MATARVESQAGRTTVKGREARISPATIARELAPLAAASGLSTLGIIALKRRSPRAGLKAARFFNLLLASLMTGNGAGAERFVHPALRALPPRAYLEAEQAITRRYPGTMLALMPASIGSGLLVAALMPRRRGRSFWFTLAGTLGFVGVLGTTLIELPLNRQTLETPPDAPQSWLEHRPRWDRFNRLRTLLAVVGWSLLCLGALSDARD